MRSKSTKAVALLAVAIVMLAGAAAFLAARGGGGDGSLYEVVDYAGNRIKLEEAPKRIVTLDAKMTEMVCELGLTSNVVGVTSDDGVHDVSDFIYGLDFDIGYPTQLKEQIRSGKTALIGGVTNWTTDQVIKADPDLVVFENSANNLNKMKMLQDMGITCLVASNTYDRVGVIYDNMELLGKALGRSDRAKMFNDGMAEAVEYIYGRCKGFEGRDVVMISAPGGTLYAYGSSNLKHVVLRSLGCTTRMAGDATGIVTVENVLEYQPDVIILDPMGKTTDMSALKRQFESDPLWADVKALRGGEIYYLEYAPFQATGYTTHHFVHGIALMAAIVFDELGVDVPQLVEGEKYLGYVSWINRRD
ncbi:MAG: ABC transporter substrate-binding protein [Candidatus Methanoplasma sp.]|nr:ABC transporter substrate-binding protein [Candidatus Methanoplasma sp.]